MDLTRDGHFDIQDVIVLCVAITSIIAACVAMRGHIVKPVATWFKKQFAETILETVTPALNGIMHEVTANGGGSLKDLVRENHEETLGLLKERDTAFARIAGPASQRMRHVEAAVEVLDRNQTQILERLDELSRQHATDSAKVLDKIDAKTASIIANQGD